MVENITTSTSPGLGGTNLFLQLAWLLVLGVRLETVPEAPVAQSIIIGLLNNNNARILYWYTRIPRTVRSVSLWILERPVQWPL